DEPEDDPRLVGLDERGPGRPTAEIPCSAAHSGGATGHRGAFLAAIRGGIRCSSALGADAYVLVISRSEINGPGGHSGVGVEVRSPCGDRTILGGCDSFSVGSNTTSC